MDRLSLSVLNTLVQLDEQKKARPEADSPEFWKAEIKDLIKEILALQKENNETLAMMNRNQDVSGRNSLTDNMIGIKNLNVALKHAKECLKITSGR